MPGGYTAVVADSSTKTGRAKRLLSCRSEPFSLPNEFLFFFSPGPKKTYFGVGSGSGQDWAEPLFEQGKWRLPGKLLLKKRESGN